MIREAIRRLIQYLAHKAGLTVEEIFPEQIKKKTDSRICGLTDRVKEGWYNRETGQVADGFIVRKEDIVLEAGCGDGGTTMFCASQGAHVIFSDIEEKKVLALAQRVKTTSARKSEPLVCDTNPLPLPDDYATRIIAMEMLEHAAEPEKVISELIRVGRPGALYLLTVPDPFGEELQRGIAPKEYFEDPNHIRVYSHESFEKLITNTGLEIINRTSNGFYWLIWMSFFWVTERSREEAFNGAILDKIVPPYHPLLESWANTWQKLISFPEGLELKKRLDQRIPKTQIVIARKPTK